MLRMTERVGDEIRGVCHGGRAVMGRQIAVGLGYFILSTVSGALPESSFSFLSHLWSSGDIQGLEELCGKEVRKCEIEVEDLRLPWWSSG